MSKEELLDGFSKIHEYSYAKKLVGKIMERIDDNKNGYLDYSEFVMASTNYNLILTKSNIKKIFKMIDVDQSGRISLENF